MARGPRIRSFKPEMISRYDIQPLNDREFRVWLTLMSQSDDEGRGVADAAHLRSLIWGTHHQVAVRDVEKALKLLARRNIVTLYTVEHVRYWFLRAWFDDQRVVHPTLSNHPAPPNLASIREHSRDRTSIRESSRGSDPIDPRDPMDRPAPSEGSRDGHAPVPKSEIAPAILNGPKQPSKDEQIEALAKSQGKTVEEFRAEMDQQAAQQRQAGSR